MAYTVKRINVRGVRDGSVQQALWRLHNQLVGALDGHTHGGVSGAGATASGNMPPLPAAAAQVLERGYRNTSGTVVAAVGSTGRRDLARTGRTGSLMGELADQLTLLITQINAHTHGVAATGGATSSGNPQLTAVSKIANLQGKDTTGDTVASPVLRLRPRGGVGSVEGELVESYNALRDAVNNHGHNNVTAGASNSNPFAFSGGVAKLADLNGRGPDGEVVS